MNAFERKIALRVVVIHVAVIGFFMIVAGLKGCFRRPPKPEIVTFIEFGQPAPPVQVQEVAEQPEPQPAPPKPEPPKEVPEPRAIPKPKPKPKELPKPKEAPKPKWKPTPVDTSKAKRIKAPEPPKPAISSKDIEKALSGISSPSAKPDEGPVGNPNEIAAYDALIHQVFNRPWVRPAVPGARPAKVTISISSTGQILSSRLSQSSGDSAFDASVMDAVRSVKMLPRKPPNGYPLDNIVVQYRIID
jgi:protein TonB